MATVAAALQILHSLALLITHTALLTFTVTMQKWETHVDFQAKNRNTQSTAQNYTMQDNVCELYTNKMAWQGPQGLKWRIIIVKIKPAVPTLWPFPQHTIFINHHHPTHHPHSPYKYLKSLSTPQLGWGQTSLVGCHSLSAPLLKEPDVVINTSVVTSWRETFLHEAMLQMFSGVLLTLFTFCSDSKLPLRCSELTAFSPAAQ